MARTRVADLIAAILVERGITDVFMLTGGGAMHLNDAFGRATGLDKRYNHHEQASAIAAESYARLSGRPACVNVTTGPGGVNALNGVYGAYVDSIPMIIVSGQVKRETIAGNYPIALRQLGDQEVDILAMARGVTKYAVSLDDPAQTRAVVERAVDLATRGRPGPVWIDVPIDVQGAMIDMGDLLPYDPKADAPGIAANTACEMGGLTGEALAAELRAIVAEMAQAERPVIMAGAGVRLSGGQRDFVSFVERWGCPVVTGWNAHDAIDNGHRQFVGRPGTIGDRAGNFTVQNADYVLVLGSRLNIRQVSYNWGAFAKNARVVMVDIDSAELAKPTLSLHRAVHADLKHFWAAAKDIAIDTSHAADRAAFLDWAKARAAAYPVVLPDYWRTPSPINPYCFGDRLFDALDEDEIVVTGDGTACVTIFQAAVLKRGQRLYTNSGCASMGYDLPAAIGAYFASGAKRIICLAGDGSIMMNLQELQTIAGLNLPIKIFVLNNDGYHSIRQTQQNYFPDNIVGCGPDSGLTFPDFHRLAAGFGLPSSRVDSHAGLDDAIAAAISGPGPHVCEVMLDKRQEFSPKLASRRLEYGTMLTPALEDMAPFLSREELASNMIPTESA